MAQITVRNPGSTPVLLQEIYMTLDAGDSTTFQRNEDELQAMTALRALWVTGTVTVEMVMDPGEAAWGSFAESDANSSFIFNPYGVPGGNLYSDWTAVVSAMQIVEGFKVLQFDNTRWGVGDGLSIPVAGTVNLHDPAGRFTANMVGQIISIDGAVNTANIGNFTITALIDACNIEYANAAGVAAAVFAGSWLVTGGGGSVAIVIPPGVWDMTQVEWFGLPFGGAGTQLDVTISDGASFTNLRRIGGEIEFTNMNNLPNPSPVRITVPAAFELGVGVTGDFPGINNVGTAPFFDLTGLPSGAFTLRQSGYLRGSTAAIDLGANPCAVNFHLINFARVASGMIKGTNTTANINIANRSEMAEVNRQNTTLSPYAGRINYGRQGANNIARPFMQTFPASVNQATPIPSGVAFTGQDLGHNGSFEITSAGAVPQSLPLIRINNAAANGLTATTAGVLNSTGLQTVWKHMGAGSINLVGNLVATGTGDSFAVSAGIVTLNDAAGSFTAAMVGRAIEILGATTPANNVVALVASFIDANSITFANAAGVTEAFAGTWRVGDTIDGAGAAHVVPAGGSRTLQSDGVSNWRVIGGYL